MQQQKYLIGEEQEFIAHNVKTPFEESQDASIIRYQSQQITNNRSSIYLKGNQNSQYEENRNQSQHQDNKEKYQSDILNTTSANPSTQRKLIIEDHDHIQLDSYQYIKSEKKQYDLFTKINEISLNNDGADKRRQLLNAVDQDLENVRTKKQSFALETSQPIAAVYDDSKKIPLTNLDVSLEALFTRQQIGNRSNQENDKTEHSNDLITSNLRKSSKKVQSERNMIKSVASRSCSDEKYANQLQMHSLDIRESKDAILGGNAAILGRISQLIKQEQDEMFTPNSLRQIGMQEDHVITRPATLVYIKKFINQLKKQLYFSIFKNLSSNQVKLINDLSYYEEGESIKPNLNKSKKCDKQFNKKQKDNLVRINGARIIYQSYFKNIIISSQSNAYMAFQVILLASIFIQICIIPFQMCFNLKSNSLYVLSIITLPVFFIGILLNCLTSYYCEGIEVKKQKKIIKRYLKTSFFQDISSFVALIISLQQRNQWISLIFLIRFNQIPKLINSIDDHFQLEHRFPSSFELLKLLFLIVTICHYCCCGFIYLGQYEVDNSDYSWLTMRKIDQYEWSVKYLNGLYFSFITMITVGYGDITPQTESEIIYVLFMTLITCGVFGYSINTIGSIFREMQIRKSELKRQKYEVSHYMRNRNIPKNIQIKVLKELEHFQLRQQQDGQKGDIVLQQLSHNIRSQVKKEYFGKILQKYKLLTLNFSEQFIEQLSLKLKELYLSPDEVVFQQGEPLNKVLCLVQGELIAFQEKIVNKSDHILVGKIKKGEFSDQRALFFEYNLQYGLKSAGISQLVYFTNEDFINTLKLFPQEYEKYCMLKDNIIFQEKFIDLKCYCCYKYGHSTDKCPMVHHIPDKFSIIFKKNKPQIQLKRQAYKRTQNRMNSVKQKFKISQEVKDIRIKIVQQFFPYYQPILPQNLSDELFFNRVPEILQSNGELLVVLDEIVDEEEEEFFSQMQSDLINKSLVLRNNNQVDFMNHSSADNPIGVSFGNTQTKQQDSLVHIPNIFQQAQHPQGENQQIKQRPSSLVEIDSKSPKLCHVNKVSSQAEINLKSPKRTNRSFPIFNDKVLNQNNPSVIQTNVQKNKETQQINQHQNILITECKTGEIHNPDSIIEEQHFQLPQFKYQHLTSQQQDVNSTYGSQISRKSNKSLNKQQSEQTFHVNINKNVYDLSQKSKINAFHNLSITQQSQNQANIFNLESPTRKNSNILNFLESPQKSALHAGFIQTTTLCDGQIQNNNSSNEQKAWPSSIRQQQQMIYFPQTSGDSQFDCISPQRIGEKKKPNKNQAIKNAVQLEQQKSQQYTSPIQFQSQQNQLFSPYENQKITSKQDINLSDLFICEFPLSSFDQLKVFKYYFTHGNIDNIIKGHVKYLISVIEHRKYFKNSFKRKIIKMYQSYLQDSFADQGRKFSRQAIYEIGRNNQFKKSSLFYQKKLKHLNKNLNGFIDTPESRPQSQTDK